MGLSSGYTSSVSGHSSSISMHPRSAYVYGKHNLLRILHNSWLFPKGRSTSGKLEKMCSLCWRNFVEAQQRRGFATSMPTNRERRKASVQDHESERKQWFIDFTFTTLCHIWSWLITPCLGNVFTLHKGNVRNSRKLMCAECDLDNRWRTMKPYLDVVMFCIAHFVVRFGQACTWPRTSLQASIAHSKKSRPHRSAYKLRMLLSCPWR